MLAITRKVGPELARCELSFQPREPIDTALAARQHAAYETALTELGAHVVSLPALEGYPDAACVEDAAVLLDEVAVITRMGAESRRGESESLEREVARYREIRRMKAPATLDGGDVLQVGKTLYVGLSRRTNAAGIEELRRLVEAFAYRVVPVPVRGCLHLKSACCWLGGSTVLANRGWIDAPALGDVEFLDVPPEEPHGANVLRLGGTLVASSCYPKTNAQLERAGYRVRTLNTSEFIKAETGLTCMSLLFEV